MLVFLRQSTAATFTVGQFVDTDGTTELTALSSQAGRLRKAGGSGAAFTPDSWAHDANGYYLVGVSTTHTDTIGAASLQFSDSANYLTVGPIRLVVLHANVFDVLFGSVAPSTHTAAAVQTLVAAGAVASVTGNVGGNVVGSVGSVTGNVGGIAGTITSLDALDTAQDAQHSATQSAISGLNDLDAAAVNAEVDSALADYDGPTKAELDAAIASIAGATFDTATDSLEALRNRGDAAWTTATGFSTLDEAAIRTAVGLASANLDTQIGTLATSSALTAVDTVVDAIQAKTDNLPASPAATGDIPSAATIAGAVRDVNNTTPAADSLGAAVNASASGGLDPQDVADLVVAGLGTVDAEIVSYAAGQDPATLLDSRLDAIDTAIAGVGGGDATAANQATIIAAIGALNDLDSTEAQAAAAAALDDYDPPTNAEMVARTLATASYATASALTTVDTVVDSIKLDTGTNGVVVATGSKAGYSLASTGLDAIIPTEPSGAPAWGASIVSWLAWLGLLGRNKQTRTAGTAAVRNDADNATIATASLSDDGTTFTRGEWS